MKVLHVLVLGVFSANVLGCHSYSTISRSEIEHYLIEEKPSGIQVFDAKCHEYSGDSWGISDDELTISDISIGLSDIVLIRKKTRTAGPAKLEGIAGLPLGLFLAIMASPEGGAGLISGFALGFAITALPTFLILKAQTFHTTVWVRDGIKAGVHYDKGEFPCR